MSKEGIASQHPSVSRLRRPPFRVLLRPIHDSSSTPSSSYSHYTPSQTSSSTAARPSHSYSNSSVAAEENQSTLPSQSNIKFVSDATLPPSNPDSGTLATPSTSNAASTPAQPTSSVRAAVPAGSSSSSGGTTPHASSWKLEFRGLTKFVKWVSKGSSSGSRKASFSQNESAYTGTPPPSFDSPRPSASNVTPSAPGDRTSNSQTLLRRPTWSRQKSMNNALPPTPASPAPVPVPLPNEESHQLKRRPTTLSRGHSLDGGIASMSRPTSPASVPLVLPSRPRTPTAASVLAPSSSSHSSTPRPTITARDDSSIREDPRFTREPLRDNSPTRGDRVDGASPALGKGSSAPDAHGTTSPPAGQSAVMDDEDNATNRRRLEDVKSDASKVDPFVHHASLSSIHPSSQEMVAHSPIATTPSLAPSPPPSPPPMISPSPSLSPPPAMLRRVAHRRSSAVNVATIVSSPTPPPIHLDDATEHVPPPKPFATSELRVEVDLQSRRSSGESGDSRHGDHSRSHSQSHLQGQSAGEGEASSSSEAHHHHKATSSTLRRGSTTEESAEGSGSGGGSAHPLSPESTAFSHHSHSQEHSRQWSHDGNGTGNGNGNGVMSEIGHGQQYRYSLRSPPASSPGASGSAGFLNNDKRFSRASTMATTTAGGFASSELGHGNGAGTGSSLQSHTVIHETTSELGHGATAYAAGGRVVRAASGRRRPTTQGGAVVVGSAGGVSRRGSGRRPTTPTSVRRKKSVTRPGASPSRSPTKARRTSPPSSAVPSQQPIPQLSVKDRLIRSFNSAARRTSGVPPAWKGTPAVADPRLLNKAKRSTASVNTSSGGTDGVGRLNKRASQSLLNVGSGTGSGTSEDRHSLGLSADQFTLGGGKPPIPKEPPPPHLFAGRRSKSSLVSDDQQQEERRSWSKERSSSVDTPIPKLRLPKLEPELTQRKPTPTQNDVLPPEYLMTPVMEDPPSNPGSNVQPAQPAPPSNYSASGFFSLGARRRKLVKEPRTRRAGSLSTLEDGGGAVSNAEAPIDITSLQEEKRRKLQKQGLGAIKGRQKAASTASLVSGGEEMKPVKPAIRPVTAPAPRMLSLPPPEPIHGPQSGSSGSATSPSATTETTPGSIQSNTPLTSPDDSATSISKPAGASSSPSPSDPLVQKRPAAPGFFRTKSGSGKSGFRLSLYGSKDKEEAYLSDSAVVKSKLPKVKSRKSTQDLRAGSTGSSPVPPVPTLPHVLPERIIPKTLWEELGVGLSDASLVQSAVDISVRGPVTPTREHVVREPPLPLEIEGRPSLADAVKAIGESASASYAAATADEPLAPSPDGAPEAEPSYSAGHPPSSFAATGVDFTTDGVLPSSSVVDLASVPASSASSFTTPTIRSSYKRAPLTSLAYTGRQGYEQERAARSPVGTRRQLTESPISGPPSLFEAPPTTSTSSPPVSFPTVPHHPRRSSTSSRPNSFGAGAASSTLLFTSPSSPAFAQKHRGSIYDVRPSSSIDESRGVLQKAPVLSSPQDSPDAVDGDSPVPAARPRPFRPPLIHRPTSNSARRWTLAVNHITDDADFLKAIDDLKRSRDDHDESLYRADELVEDDAEDDYQQAQRDALAETEVEGGEDDERVWLKARRAMLCVREIIRTESTYRRHLLRVYETETNAVSSTAPVSFLDHLPILIAASLSFSTLLEEDPSAWGVSAAFLGVEDELERAMVSWCRVVGQVMMELMAIGASTTGTWSSLYTRRLSTKDIVKEAAKEAEKERDRELRPRRTETGGSGSSSGHISYPPSAKMAKFTKKDKLKTTSAPPSAATSPTLGVPRSKPLGIQDVAIMPSQRIPRYVLLFKDLLQQTPVTSPSRALVERALEGATRIAKNCDAAQQHESLSAN